MKKYKAYIDTLGCNKNDYDSEVMSATLMDAGFILCDNPLEADYLIVNTCGFINDAKSESIERILELADIKSSKQKLIVTGCLSQRYHDELIKEIPEVDAYFGVNEYDILPSKLSDINDLSVDNVTNDIDNMPYRKRAYNSKSHYGYLKIAEGCNNACAFCAIPSIRGPFRSKRIEDCIHEAQDMANAGIKELILIAEDTSQYGRDLYGELKLPELLKELCKIDDIEWIRLLYVYDNAITDELIGTISNEEKICNYIDIPIQHISDNVLHRMKRQSSSRSIRNTINKLRDSIPEIHIRTTLLVGFPGETESDIEELIQFVDEMEIDRLGAFAYSDEEGTCAYNLDNKLDDFTKILRRNDVMEHQKCISEKLNERKIGSIQEVIIDEIASENIYIGRSRYDAPDIDCEITFSSKKKHQPGDIVNVKIINAYEYDLDGEEIE